MNARRLVCSIVFALLAAPAAALACTDAGPPNASCNDGGALWIGCTDHAQCPEGQYCSAQGACGCGARDARDASVCDDSGCHGCAPRAAFQDAACSNQLAYMCPDPAGPDAAVDSGATDAGVGFDTGTPSDVVSVDLGPPSSVVDAGGGGGGGGGGGDGCSVRAPGDRTTGRGAMGVLLAIGAVMATRRRRWS